MSMPTLHTYCARITPLSALGTPLSGDTLFGQLCWTLRNRYGEERLIDLLGGYTQGQPFMVVANAYPAGYLPKPSLPAHGFQPSANEANKTTHKTAKKQRWLPIEQFVQPLAQWQTYCRSDQELAGALPQEYPQTHNTLNRITGTTGEGPFAPYTVNQFWYGHKDQQPQLDIYLVLDTRRLPAAELQPLLTDIGHTGFGRDASTGLGKFRLDSLKPLAFPCQTDTNAWMTLAPCAPQGQAWDEKSCFYRVLTRFGRHGDISVHGPHGPFKSPVLFAEAGAILTPLTFTPTFFIGQGLGGNGQLSKTLPATVHQGYAPVFGIKL